MVCLPEPLFADVTPIAKHTQEWEDAASNLTELLKTEETIFNVEAKFMTMLCPATLTLLYNFMAQLLIGAQKQAVPTGCLHNSRNLQLIACIVHAVQTSFMIQGFADL
jgi:hypothetical protein